MNLLQAFELGMAAGAAVMFAVFAVFLAEKKEGGREMNKFEEYLLALLLYMVVCGICFLAEELLDMDAMALIAAIALWGTIHNDVKSNNPKEDEK